jgi:hypothetical protein
MKPVYSIFATALFCALLWSCRKEISDLPETYTEEITTVTPSGYAVHMYTLTYDENRRILTKFGAGKKLHYNYGSGNTVTTITYDDGGVTVMEEGTYYLNNNQLVDSSVVIRYRRDTTTKKYFYDTQGRLVRINLYHYPHTATGPADGHYIYEYDSNGNLSKEVLYRTNGNPDNSKKYTYTSYPAAYSLEPPYMPKPMKFLPATVLATYFWSGAFSVTTSINYSFDKRDRITNETALSNNGDKVIKTYTY